ncbi:MAG: HAMP domain-containing histidine kinase [Desulfobulbaceae bacterium]|nr:HAMP domain-containing histidine kinase [Desulfobulbaceae bacterium]
MATKGKTELHRFIWAIIRQHGGRLSVESMPGKGSVFIVRLPKHNDQNLPYR